MKSKAKREFYQPNANGELVIHNAAMGTANNGGKPTKQPSYAPTGKIKPATNIAAKLSKLIDKVNQ